jgi:pectate lyase
MKPLSIILFLGLLISCSQKNSKPKTWQSIEKSLQTQFITVADGDTVRLPEGNFMFTKSLTMDGKNNVVIKGKGMDKTILSWKNQTEGAEGMHISNGKNIVLEDFSIEDAKGDNLKVNEVVGITFRPQDGKRCVWFLSRAVQKCFNRRECCHGFIGCGILCGAI